MQTDQQESPDHGNPVGILDGGLAFAPLTRQPQGRALQAPSQTGQRDKGVQGEQQVAKHEAAFIAIQTLRQQEPSEVPDTGAPPQPAALHPELQAQGGQRDQGDITQ